MKLRGKCTTAAEAAEKQPRSYTDRHGWKATNQPEPSQQNTERRASIL